MGVAACKRKKDYGLPTPQGQRRLIIIRMVAETFAQHVGRMGWRPEASKRFVCDMPVAVLCVQGRGLVHSDLKPDNIMLTMLFAISPKCRRSARN